MSEQKPDLPRLASEFLLEELVGRKVIALKTSRGLGGNPGLPSHLPGATLERDFIGA